MKGEGEYLRDQGNQVLLVERGTKGMTIVNMGEGTNINSPTNLREGSYKDTVSGNTFNVSGGRIYGNVDGGKIAVLMQN